MNFTYKTKYIHLLFLTFLFLHYIFSLIFVGQIVIEPHDILDGTVVNDHIISKIYKGNVDSLSYLLSGEIKWYYLEKLFYPINILHYLLSDKLFYFTVDILKKTLAYFSFYLLSKSLSISRFYSALGGILYSTLVFNKMNLGLAISIAPYILYLLLNKDTLNKKHYFFLFLIGLNSSLIHDIFVYFFLIPLSLLLNNKNKSLNIYFQIFSVIFISSMMSNIHLVIGSIFSEPIHREAWSVAGKDILLPFIEVFTRFFTYGSPKNTLFVFNVPIIILTAFIFVLSFFSKQKNIRLVLFFIIFILILKSLTHHNIIDNIFIGPFEILKAYNFQRVGKIIPMTFTLLFILFISSLQNNFLKKFLYFISFLSILSLQLKTPLPLISQHFLKENMHIEKFDKAKDMIIEKKYIQFFEIIFDKKSYTTQKENFNNQLNKTFDNYYKFKDYTFIRNIVKNSRVMSVGLDPMIAVMNDIRVIDGYHTIYPLSYKIKFRKIIERELENNIQLKNYYDTWGSRVYAFYSDKNKLMLNFHYAKKLGADYVISRFPIENNELKKICHNCNNSKNLFLYKIL
jgi:hypothetical protein